MIGTPNAHSIASSDFFSFEFVNDVKASNNENAPKTKKRFLRNAIMSTLVGIVPAALFDIDGELMKEERDTQRRKLYRADDSLKAFAVPLVTVDDVERFVKKVWNSKRVQAAFPKAVRYDGPRVKDGRGTRIARGGWGMINIPLWARTSDVVLHELAHTITIRVYGDYVAAHGWQYCAVFLKLTRYIMGRDAYKALKDAMRKNRCKFKSPRPKRVLTDEQKAALVQRMAVARAARKPAEPEALAA